MGAITLRAYDSNFCFDIWRVTNADYLLTYLLTHYFPPAMMSRVSDNF